MDADVVLTLGSCIKRKQIFSELTELNIPPTGLNFLHALQMLRISVHNSGHFLFKLFDKFSNSFNP
jgi:hypothetical protein